MRLVIFAASTLLLATTALADSNHTCIGNANCSNTNNGDTNTNGNTNVNANTNANTNGNLNFNKATGGAGGNGFGVGVGIGKGGNASVSKSGNSFNVNDNDTNVSNRLKNEQSQSQSQSSKSYSGADADANSTSKLYYNNYNPQNPVNSAIAPNASGDCRSMLSFGFQGDDAGAAFGIPISSNWCRIQNTANWLLLNVGRQAAISFMCREHSEVEDTLGDICKLPVTLETSMPKSAAIAPAYAPMSPVND